MQTRYLDVELLFDREEIHRRMDEFIEDRQATYVCAVNANTITVANNDPRFKEIVNQSGFNLCDGSLVALSYKHIYKKKVPPYPGPNFFIDYLSKRQYRSFFLGSTDDLLMSLREKLAVIDPEIPNMKFYAPPFVSLDVFDYEEIGSMINAEEADIIWVSLGAPKQEEFMYRLRPFLGRGVMVGVGAAFSFYGDDNYKRAPEFIRKMCLEWLHRSITNLSVRKRFIRQIYYMPQLIIREYMRERHRGV
jgi:N-acetylglucosaminyldiphosphoundecaprenol N-acetyl-beta-D-mannosaminyltransferase